jgi:DNA-3-methyladenine glycosylase
MLRASGITERVLRIVDDGYRLRRVMVTPRIGIVKAAEQPLRYFIAGNPFVSGKKY